MPKPLHHTLFFLLFTIGTTQAQSLDERLTGSWSLVYYKNWQDSTIVPDDQRSLSFYSDHTYQECTSFTGYEKVASQAGRWHPGKKKIILYYVHNLPYQSDIAPYQETRKLVSLTDSTLSLSGSDEGDESSIYFYRRTTPRPPMYDDFSVSRIPEDFLEYRYYLVRNSDTSKKTRLRTNISINIRTGEPGFPLIHARKNKFHGFMLGLSDTAVRFRRLNDDPYIASHDLFIPLEQIRSIDYSGPTKTMANLYGAGIITLSGFTALVLAPLVSINYLKGGFNSKRYLTWAGIGLGGLAISIPFTILTRCKTYQIAYGSHAKKTWHLQRKFIPCESRF